MKGSVNRFRFLERRYDPRTGEARLGYALDNGAHGDEGDRQRLVETLKFPWAPWPPEASRQAAFLRALDLLHLVAGVSYWKAAIPSKLDLGDHRLDPAGADFLRELYEQGLAEFAHVNGLDLAGKVPFEANRETIPEPPELVLPERALVAMGGGKDSLVALEMLRDAGIEVQPVTVGGSALVAETVAAAGLPLLRIERRLAPELAELNRAGAWNGHVPVTAINSLVLLCAAILYGFRWVVFANERSADEATLEDARGRAVNHQYSKSLAFEGALADRVERTVAGGLEYCSLLRPLWEVAVAERFSRLQAYHGVFSSCNRNFHQDGPRIPGRWCGDCPKCRFTFLALAPHLEPARLREIFGADLLDDPAQEPGYRALCGLGAEKPFECVGTVSESRALLAALASRDGWRDHAVVRALADHIDEPPGRLEELLAERGPHRIPDALLRRLEH
jgi:hypothetical protein